MPIVAPSLLAADFLQLQKDCDLVNNSVAEWFHLDVMDGRFVPNISYGPGIVKAICSTTSKFCDVHLMIEAPELLVDEFKKAGADQITVHYEACTHLHRNIEQIKNAGLKAGVALNPHTPVSLLEDILPMLDTVCIMSVNPGFGGQKFIPQSLSKIDKLRNMKQKLNPSLLIEVDGGVGLENAQQIVESGADVLVAGSAVFAAKDPLQVINLLHQISK